MEISIQTTLAYATLIRGIDLFYRPARVVPAPSRKEAPRYGMVGSILGARQSRCGDTLFIDTSLRLRLQKPGR